MPTFSLIVPVYKIEDYLEKCIASVLAQDCADYELLLIDDGSPDHCGVICDRYAASHPQIHAIHQANGGAGAARNRGIAASTGDYLLFVDGDDYLEPNMLSCLKAEIDRSHPELVVFGAVVERNGKKVGELHENLPPHEVCNAEAHPDLFFGVMAPWNRAYHRSLFEHISFATKVWYEDIRVVTKINALANTVVRLPECLYHYLQREGSAMNNRNSDRNVEILYAFDDLRQWFQAHDLLRYEKELTFLAIQHIFLAATVRVLLIDRRHPLIGQFREYMERYFPAFAESPYLDRLDRNKRLIFQLLLKKHDRIVCAIFKLRKL